METLSTIVRAYFHRKLSKFQHENSQLRQLLLQLMPSVRNGNVPVP